MYEEPVGSVTPSPKNNKKQQPSHVSTNPQQSADPNLARMGTK